MGSHLLWTVLERKIAFADPRLRVRSDLCLTPQGEVVGPAHVIEYPDHVTTVALTPDASKIVLVRRYRHGSGSIVSGLPSGTIEPAPGTPQLDMAEIVTHRHTAHRAGKMARLNFRPRPGDNVAVQAAAEQAAKRELLEQTGYAATQWICLFKGHSDSARQTNASFCFLATGLEPVLAPAVGPTGVADEIIEQDFLTVMRLMRQGCLMMDVLHGAALWSAAFHIAADQTSRFGRLSMQLRRFFVGQDDDFGGDLLMPTAFPASAVGG